MPLAEGFRRRVSIFSAASSGLRDDEAMVALMRATSHAGECQRATAKLFLPAARLRDFWQLAILDSTFIAQAPAFLGLLPARGGFSVLESLFLDSTSSFLDATFDAHCLLRGFVTMRWNPPALVVSTVQARASRHRAPCRSQCKLWLTSWNAQRSRGGAPDLDQGLISILGAARALGVFAPSEPDCV